MVYKYRVTLAGIKGFYRVYEMRGETTLYEFHKQMRADMEFPQDQLIMFKAMDAGGGVLARYGLFDLGSGTVDNVTVAQTVKNGVASFLYFYDVPNRKSVIVTFEGVEENIKASALNALRKALWPEGLEELNETLLDNPMTDAIIAAAETLPFMADKRLVTVR